MAELNEKQKVFCNEYLIDLNATQAAIRAGYSKKTAGEHACRLLKDVRVHAYIEKAKAERSQRTEITSDFVLTGLKEVAERCLQKVPVLEWDYENRCMRQKTDESGNAVWEFDSTGANRAFELLGRHIGIFEKDNSQKKEVVQPMNDSQVDKIIETLKGKKR